MSSFSNLLTALGWSLLDSIWQMALVWTAYHIITAGYKRFSSAGKHNLILLFVFLGTEWFVYNFIQRLNEPVKPVISGFIPLPAFANQWIPFLSFCYLVFLLIRFQQCGFHVPVKPLKNLVPTPVFIQTFANRYTRILGITKNVSVYISDLAETAETSGFLKPMILLPLALINRLTTEQVEAILAHELYHIRRNDYLIHICMTCFRCIFFFNPFALLFYKELEREREHACDDGVLELGYQPAVYAEALYNLERVRQVSPGFYLAADGNRPWLLMERIRRVLGSSVPNKNRFRPLILRSLLAAFLLFGLQQKSILRNWTVPRTAMHDPVIPVHTEIGAENSTVAVTALSRKISQRVYTQTVHIRQQEKKVLWAIDQVKLKKRLSGDNEDLGYLTVFAQDNTPRNFTNEQSSTLVKDPVAGFPGTPYLPSVSLLYEDLPDLGGPDSMMSPVIQYRLENKKINSRLKVIENLDAMEKEIVKSKKQLREIEFKYRKLIKPDSKRIKSFVEKMQQKLEGGKQQIQQFRNRIDASWEEIIHI